VRIVGWKTQQCSKLSRKFLGKKDMTQKFGRETSGERN